jgi:hypothetical protein
MPKADRPTITLDADDQHRLHATWSRSSRLLLTVTDTRFGEPRQIQLRPDQVTELIAFLEAGTGD